MTKLKARYATDSVMDDFRTCRGSDAAKIWEMIQTGAWNVGQVAKRMHRGVRYVHGLLQELQSENRVAIGDQKLVREKTVIVLFGQLEE